VLGAILLSGCSTLGLDRLSGDPSAAGAPAPDAKTRQAQLVLQQQGTYNGRVDGVPGPATQEAIRLYQQSHKLDATGQIDEATRSSLNLDAKQEIELPHTQMADGSKMSEADARKMIESQGYSKVKDLYRDDSAVWRGVATKDGKSSEVAIDAKGQVVVN
jgi:peptidoglycan hydrolase-like protein with peptidoglycan-binding domain